MRYYNKSTKTEVIETAEIKAGILPAGVVSLPLDNVFFHKLPSGHELVYDANGLPQSTKEIIISPEDKKAADIAAIKLKRDTDLLGVVTVTHNEKEWSFKAIDRDRFVAKLALGRDFSWQADDSSEVSLTHTVARNIAKKVDDELSAIFFYAAAEMAAL